MYGIFQYGGHDRHEFLSANDKDISPTLEALTKLVTTDLARLMKDLTGDHPMDLDDKEDDVAYLTETFQDNYLDMIFGDRSRMSYSEWMQAMLDRKDINELWFDPQRLREMVLHKI